MSRAWIAFYMGDYQKDTNRLTTLEHGAYFLLLQECWTHGAIPIADEDRAAITKMPPREWLKVAAKIGAFFNDDGTQKRATKEIEKAEATRLRKAVAGHLGGSASGVTRALKAAQSKQTRSRREAEHEAAGRSETKLREPTLNSKITSSFSEGPRASSEPVETPQGDGRGELVKPPSALTRAELEAIYASRKHSPEETA